MRHSPRQALNAAFSGVFDSITQVCWKDNSKMMISCYENKLLSFSAATRRRRLRAGFVCIRKYPLFLRQISAFLRQRGLTNSIFCGKIASNLNRFGRVSAIGRKYLANRVYAANRALNFFGSIISFMRKENITWAISKQYLDILVQVFFR